MNHIHLKLALVFSALIILMWMVLSLPAQTLQRHPYPPKLHPESCRDHVAHTRHILLDTIKVEIDPNRTKHMSLLYHKLDDPRSIELLCASAEMVKEYDVILSLAELRRRQLITARESLDPPFLFPTAPLPMP